MPREDAFTPPSPWCPEPWRWHAEDGQATEREVSVLAAAFVRALQPANVVETGAYLGQTSRAIGEALALNGHGHLTTVEINEHRAAVAKQACAGLPVTVICGDSLQVPWPDRVGFAWLDSEAPLRVQELMRLRDLLTPGAVVGFHDTGPQHDLYRRLVPLLEAGKIAAITLRTPRGVTFAQVLDPGPW